MEKKMKHKDVIKLVKRNETQDFVNATTGYFKKHTENIIIAAVIIVVVIVAIPLYLNGRNTAELKAEQSLAEANYYVNRPVLDDPQAAMYGLFRSKKEKYDKIEAAYTNVLQNFKGTKAYPSAMLGLANAYYNNEQYVESLEYFNSFISKFPKHLLLPDAVSGKAYVFFQQGKYADAATEWEKVIKTYNGGNNKYDIKLKLAECYSRMNDKTAAKAMCEEIVKDTKEGYWANMAKDILSKIN